MAVPAGSNQFVRPLSRVDGDPLTRPRDAFQANPDWIPRLHLCLSRPTLDADRTLPNLEDLPDRGLGTTYINRLRLRIF
jgi:hypothetical protein